MKIQVQSLTSLSWLGSSIALSCAVGHRCSSDPTLLWLWCRLTTAALIWSLAWELPYATPVALKSKKQNKQTKTQHWFKMTGKEESLEKVFIKGSGGEPELTLAHTSFIPEPPRLFLWLLPRETVALPLHPPNRSHFKDSQPKDPAKIGTFKITHSWSSRCGSVGYKPN